MGTMFVLCILAAIVVLIVRGMYRDKQQGKSCGCSGCTGCRLQGQCHAGSHHEDRKKSVRHA